MTVYITTLTNQSGTIQDIKVFETLDLADAYIKIQDFADDYVINECEVIKHTAGHFSDYIGL